MAAAKVRGQGGAESRAPPSVTLAKCTGQTRRVTRRLRPVSLASPPRGATPERTTSETQAGREDSRTIEVKGIEHGGRGHEVSSRSLPSASGTWLIFHPERDERKPLLLHCDDGQHRTKCKSIEVIEEKTTVITRDPFSLPASLASRPLQLFNLRK